MMTAADSLPPPPPRAGCAARRVVRAAAASVAVLAGATALRAQSPLSLEQALVLAERQNPELQATRARAEAEESRAESARRARWPRVSVTSRWSRSNTPSTVFAQKLDAGVFTEEDFAVDRLGSPDARSHLTTGLAAEVPLDAFGSIASRAEAAAAAGRARRALADEALQDLRLRVVEAYRRADLAARLVSVAERAVAGARSREADVAARVEEGAALGADLLRARARRRQREADLAERRADADVAGAALARALGAGPDASHVLTDAVTAPPALEGDAGSWRLRALAARPALRAAGLLHEARRWSARAEARAGWPELSGWGQVQEDRAGLDAARRSGSVGLLLRWSPFDATRGRRVAAAAVEERAAELDVRAARDQVCLEVETAWRRAESSRTRYAAAAGGAEEGREALRVVRERRLQGLATLTDELETESAGVEAEVGELRAAAEAAVADAALRRAAGGL
jgi:OMF family outer membrane factor